MLQKLFNIQTVRLSSPPHSRLSIFIVLAEANSKKSSAKLSSPLDSFMKILNNELKYLTQAHLMNKLITKNDERKKLVESSAKLVF
jgi:hypothetical protein